MIYIKATRSMKASSTRELDLLDLLRLLDLSELSKLTVELTDDGYYGL